MAMPCAASVRSPRIHGATASGASSKSAPSKSFCRSRSGNMSHSRDRVSLVRFGNEHLERWDVCVPLNQGRGSAETLQRGRIQLPNSVADRPVVGINENLLLPDSSRRVPCEVKFLYRAARQRLQIYVRVKPVIASTDIHVVDV